MGLEDNIDSIFDAMVCVDMYIHGSDHRHKKVPFYSLDKENSIRISRKIWVDLGKPDVIQIIVTKKE